MIGIWALAAALQATAINWDALPPLPYRAPPAVTPDMRTFVGREVRVRKCPRPGTEIQLDIAVLIDETGEIRTAVPRAINCPSVEQYGAALIAGFARNNLLPRIGASEQWYRTSLTFILPK